MSLSNSIVILSDANVLIDYYKANKKILFLATQNLFQIYVPRSVLKEVKQLSIKNAKEIGIKIIDPTLEQLFESSQRGGKLSFQDKLCLSIARDNKWICATNDKVLRKECTKQKVSIIWGLEVMIQLNSDGFLSKKEAIKTVQSIGKENLRITQKTVERFIKKLI